jgi:hypothetical protein
MANINKHHGLVELYNNRHVQGFAMRFNTNSLLFLCLLVSESVSEDMEKNSPYLYEMPWVPYNKDNKIIHVVSLFKDTIVTLL